MYRYIKIFSFAAILGVALLSACRKDLGNYTYHDINEGSISGIDPSYNVRQGGQLKIEPVLEFTMEKDTSKFSYEWFSLDGVENPIIRTTLATTPNLDWVVSLPAKDASYKVYYKVTEKSTGQSWNTYFMMKVTTNLADGWVVLNESDGVARLDYLNYLSASDSFEYYQDILASQQSMKLQGKPVNVTFWYRRHPFTLAFTKTVAVSTDYQTMFFNTTNNKYSEFQDMSKSMSVYNAPPYYALGFQTVGRQNQVVFTYDNLGVMMMETAASSMAMGVRLNKLADGTPFKISKWIATEMEQTPNYELMYDTERKRFMEHRGTNAFSTIAANTNAAPGVTPLFDPANMNMELLYMAYTKAIDGRVYAVFKDNAGAVFLARIKCGTTTFIPLSFDKISDLAPGIAGAGMFAVDPVEGYLFYTLGAKVYRYTPDRKTNVMVADYGDKTITLLKFQRVVYSIGNTRYETYGTKLIVASCNATAPAGSGKMDMYNVPNLDGNLSIYKSFTGFDKIVSVTYRE